MSLSTCFKLPRAAILLLAGLSSYCSPSTANKKNSLEVQAMVLGTYRVVSPYQNDPMLRNVPVPDAAVELTTDQAIYHTGSAALTATYTVDDEYVHLKSGSGQINFQRIGADTLRSKDAMGNHLDYVRSH